MTKNISMSTSITGFLLIAFHEINRYLWIIQLGFISQSNNKNDRIHWPYVNQHNTKGHHYTALINYN